MDYKTDPIDPEVLKLIEEKRKKAMELRKRKLEEQHSNLDVIQLPKSTLLKSPEQVPSKVSDVKSNLNIYNNLRQDKNRTKNCQTNYTEIKNRLNPLVKNLSRSIDNETFTKSNGQNEKKIVKMSIILESASRFEVSFSYNEEIKNIFKSIASRRWDPNTKKWSFAIESFQEIMSQLKNLIHKNIDIKYEEIIPETLIQCLIDQSKKKSDVDLNERLRPEFIQSLYPYQREGIIFGIQRDGKCLIADDMGLGKSIQAIGLATWYREDWPLIIVCPSSLRYQWMKFILQWIPDISENDIFLANNTKILFPKVPITITSYELMTRMRNRFIVETNRFYNMIVMDESHYIKSDITQRTCTASLIARSCKRIILLSGTPALSRPMELFPQLNIINPELFPSKHGFGLRYCNAKKNSYFRNGKPIIVWDYKGAQNLTELKIILENTIMIRRLKKDVLNELPSKKREIVCLSMDHLQEKDKNMMIKLKNEIKCSRHKLDQTLAFKLFNESADAKIPAVQEYLKDILQKDVKLICFCHHKSMMDGVEEMLNKEKISHIRIDGHMLQKARQEACEVFQEKEHFKVALLSLTACATGLNLTSASMVIFAEVYWNPGVLAQAEDRVHRIGQTNNVRIIYLLSRGTIDEIMWPLISKKLDILNRAGLSRDTFNDTHNPLQVDENQSLITEFINSLSQNHLDTMSNGNDDWFQDDNQQSS